MLSRLCAQKFTTQIQGVPIQLLEAMKFDIPKVQEERQKNIRTLTCYLQDRLHDSQLMEFVRDVEQIREKVLEYFDNRIIGVYEYFTIEIQYFQTFQLMYDFIVIADQVLDLVQQKNSNLCRYEYNIIKNDLKIFILCQKIKVIEKN